MSTLSTFEALGDGSRAEPPFSIVFSRADGRIGFWSAARGFVRPLKEPSSGRVRSIMPRGISSNALGEMDGQSAPRGKGGLLGPVEGLHKNRTGFA